MRMNEANKLHIMNDWLQIIHSVQIKNGLFFIFGLKDKMD